MGLKRRKEPRMIGVAGIGMGDEYSVSGKAGVPVFLMPEPPRFADRQLLQRPVHVGPVARLLNRRHPLRADFAPELEALLRLGARGYGRPGQQQWFGRRYVRELFDSANCIPCF